MDYAAPPWLLAPLSKTAPYGAVLLSWLSVLDHLHPSTTTSLRSVGYGTGINRLYHLNVDSDTRGQVEVREGLYHLRRRVHDVDKALMDAHLELLACVFVDET